MSKIHESIRHRLRLVLAPVRYLGRAAGNLLRSMTRGSDYARWNSPGGLEEWWEARTKLIAEWIPDGSEVIEFGAGRRQLERHLPAACRYTPSDLVSRGEGTIVCDLNHRPLPDLRDRKWNVAVFGGVLEYIKDVASLAEWLASIGIQTCIISFDAVPERLSLGKALRERLRRRHFGYMNCMTERQLLECLEAARFVCTGKRTWTTQGIHRFERSAGAAGAGAGTAPGNR